MMTILEFPQRSPEWYAARRGVPTASDFDKIVTSTGAPSKQRQKYLYQLAGERLGAVIEDGFQSVAMLAGIEKESEAKAYYELYHAPIQEVGFCMADGYGASPDAFVDEDGLLEIKCPIVSTHVEYLLANRLPPDYVQQVQGQLLVTGRQWVDFLSYFPGLNPLLIRVERDKVFIKALKAELKSFCAELDEIVSKLQK